MVNNESAGIDRRKIIKVAGAAAASVLLPARAIAEPTQSDKNAPGYLNNYATQYASNPRAAAQAWFANAKYGLFMHYGLYSQLARGEWVMLQEKIPIPEYMKLKKTFTAKRFDADFITDMALEAGMKYVNLTSRHHDGFSLFDTSQNDYHAMASPAKRDLVGELAEQCQKKDLGLFLYYSYAADWWHPWFYDRESGWHAARPAYKVRPERYRWSKDEDFRKYVDFVHAQLRELLTNYGPLAGIWFDPIMGFYARPNLFPIEETYALVRSLQPQVMISFKQGANGTEDFAAPERGGSVRLVERVKKIAPRWAHVAAQAWDSNKEKHNEICDTLQPHVWGHKKADADKLRQPDEVMKMLQNAWSSNCNLLLNTGPLPDGSINPPEVKTFRDVGAKLRKEGLIGS
jgi:alpha-L-fucosidase